MGCFPLVKASSNKFLTLVEMTGGGRWAGMEEKEGGVKREKALTRRSLPEWP